MNIQQISSFGELKASGYKSLSIKEELRKNLCIKIQNKEKSFEGIWGYDHSVIPELETAILSKHNINLLGLRGQAKTRLARLMIQLLDEWIPVVQGSEINDDPFNPISRYAKELLEEQGDNTPISWLHRSERFVEKLATPDVSIADLIGDIDPIKAANLRLSYADDRVIHYGMIPRANRCLFVINEIPDLQARIQVALFNILEEGDIQIRGFKLRLPLNIQFIFTANPEDYTNRGSIVTPLKDRIGSQILTHYPQNIEVAKRITAQEANILNAQERIHIPEIARDLLEQIAFEARKSPYVDHKSGVSARLSISAMENLFSNAERRLLRSSDKETSIRLSDFMGIIPSITGKIELVYEGEQEGAATVAQKLIFSACRQLFNQFFPKISKLQHPNTKSPYADLINWFLSNSEVRIGFNDSDAQYQEQLEAITPLGALVDQYASEIDIKENYFFRELILWALVSYEQLSKEEFVDGLEFKDNLGALLRDL